MKDILAQNAMEVRGRVAEVCQEYDRDVNDIFIVAITKSFPSSIISTAVAAGFHHIGESRVQEAESKIAEIGRIACYHMVGHLQTNKAKKAVQLFDVIQSVDSLRLAEEINRAAKENERTIECYVQVNCSGEDQKFGVAINDCLELIKRAVELENIKLTGLMTIGPLSDDHKAISSAFAKCRGLFEKGREICGNEFEHLSMGMSDDYPLAIAEGATTIRLGSALFGPRPVRK
jgi:hypothetical protein